MASRLLVLSCVFFTACGTAPSLDGGASGGGEGTGGGAAMTGGGAGGGSAIDDAGTTIDDAGTTLDDAGTTLEDAGTTLDDAGTTLDAGSVDAGTTLDAGVSNDAGSTTDTSPPTAPTDLIAVAVSAGQINLRWLPSTDDVGVTAYRLERCDFRGCSTFTEIAASPAVQSRNTGLTASTQYTFRVRAVDAAGNFSPYSATTDATTSTAPATVPSGLPGLRNPDGSLHPPHTPNVTTATIDVVARAAQLGVTLSLADTAADDAPAVQAVLAAATAGTTVFFPNGVYNLRCPSTTASATNLALTRSFVNLEGESQGGVIFKSDCDDANGASYSGISLLGVHDVALRNFTVTSTWNRTWPTSTTVNNPEAGGLTYGVATGFNATRGASFNITIENVTVERFSRLGFRIAGGSHDIVVRNARVRRATDLAGGGAGYGIAIQGATHLDAATNPYLGDASKDTYFVLVEGTVSEPDYIRHAILLQYWTHNNLVIGNVLRATALDSIDLHGEDEYANEIAFNQTRGSKRAGIGLGNSGAGHDKTGIDNWVHNNELIAGTQGITVEYGTNLSTIERNLMRDDTSSTMNPVTGVLLGKSSQSVLRENVFLDNTATGFFAVTLADNAAEGTETAGSPTNWTIVGNRVTNSGTPLRNTATMSSGNTIQTTW